MNHKEIIRKKIRQSLKSCLLNENSEVPHREEMISYLDKCLNEFASEFKQIALENNHPYVNIYLRCAIAELKEAIEKGRKTIMGIDEMLLDPEMRPK